MRNNWSSSLLTMIIISGFIFIIDSGKNNQSISDIMNNRIFFASPSIRPSESPSSIIWEREHQDVYDCVGTGLWGVDDDIYVCGYVDKTDTYDNILIIKWDDQGSLMWQRSWNGPGSSTDIATGIWGDVNGIYLGGRTDSMGAGNEDLLLVKWDKDGNVIWNRTWGGAAQDGCNAVWGDGVYIYTAGYTRSFGSGLQDVVLVKWTTAGDQVWNRTWGGTAHDWCEDMWVEGNSIYLCGTTYSYDLGYGDMVMIEWDSAGNQVWNKTWGTITGEEHGRSISGDSTGIYTSITSTESSFWVINKWDTDGQLLWTKGKKVFEIYSDGTSIYTATNAGLNPETLYKMNKDDGEIVWFETQSFYGSIGGIQCLGGLVYTCGSKHMMDNYNLVLIKWLPVIVSTPAVDWASIFMILVFVGAIIVILLYCVWRIQLLPKIRRKLNSRKQNVHTKTLEISIPVIDSFTSYLKKAQELAKKGQKTFDNGNFNQARTDWEGCVEFYQKALKIHPPDGTPGGKVDHVERIRESINITRQNILNTYVNAAVALDKEASKHYENRQFDDAQHNWNEVKKDLSEAAKYVKSQPGLRLDLGDDAQMIVDSIDKQLIRVNIARILQDAESMISVAKHEQSDNLEGAIERVNKALVLLRKGYSTAKDIDEILANQVKEKITEGIALQQAIQNEFNELMGLPRLTEAARLEKNKDVIDELDKQFAEWNSREKRKQDKI